MLLIGQSYLAYKRGSRGADLEVQLMQLYHCDGVYGMPL